MTKDNMLFKVAVIVLLTMIMIYSARSRYTITINDCQGGTVAPKVERIV